MGFGIGTSTFLRIQQIQPTSINEKIVLSCPCYRNGYWNFGFLEILIAHELGSVEL